MSKALSIHPTQSKVALACARARSLESAGEYQDAWRELSSFWRGAGHRPEIKNLPQELAAEVLLRAGSLTGWIGNARQLEGAQATAQGLVSEAMGRFEQIGDYTKVAECENALALCYWRSGSYDEARIILSEALQREITDTELKISILLNLALIEWSDHKFQVELQYQEQAARLIEGISSDALKGRFHHGNALCWKSLKDDDRAFIEFAMASKHYEQAGHKRFCARVENNLAGLYLKKGMLDEAYESATKAIELFGSLRPSDRLGIAATEETRARVLLEQGLLHEAKAASKRSVALLEQGDGDAIMVENLVTYGRVLARLGDRREAQNTLRHAYNIARVSISEERASQIACVIMDEVEEVKGNVFSYAGMSLDEAVRKLREKMIREAMEDCQGDTRLAAMRLGVKSYQNLQYYVNKPPKNYSNNLAKLRPPVKSRNRSTLSLVKKKT